MTAYFITATGTDIGKTYVTAGLIHAFKQRGIIAQGLKPIVSGYTPETAAASDPGVLLTAMGETVTEDNISRISPWRFAAPLSPDMAAAREKRTIDFAQLIAFSRAAIAADAGALLIEGVGGVMVPIGKPRTTLDWMLALNLPVIVVGGSYLGAISHMLTAVDVILRRNLRIGAVVINESAGSSVTLDDTAATVKDYLAISPASAAPLVTIPRNAGEKAFGALVDALTA